jgi:hypothetical protein
VKASPCIEAHLSKKFEGMLPLHCAIKVERTGTVKAYTPKGELRPHLALKYSSASEIMKLWNHYPEAASIVDISTRIYPYQLKGKSRKKTMTSQDAKVDLKPLNASVLPIYSLSDTINLFYVLFFIIINKSITCSAS